MFSVLSVKMAFSCSKRVCKYALCLCLFLRGWGRKKKQNHLQPNSKQNQNYFTVSIKMENHGGFFFFFKIKVVLLQRASCLVILFPLGLTLYCSSFIFQCIKALSQAATRGSQEIAQGWPDKVKPIPAFTKSLLAGGSSSFRAVAFS